MNFPAQWRALKIDAKKGDNRCRSGIVRNPAAMFTR